MPHATHANAADGAIHFALSQVGKPYQWGATGPNAYDCSGLVKAAYGSVGITIPRTTYSQLAGLRTKIQSLSECLPGDLIYPDIGHVQLYLGNNKIVEAPRTGLKVRVTDTWGFLTARRVTAPGTSANLTAAQMAAAAAAGVPGGCMIGLITMPLAVPFAWWVK